MKTSLLLIIILFHSFKLCSQQTNLVVWTDEFDCILNQSISQNSITEIVAHISDTLTPHYFYTNQPEAEDKVIKMPMTRFLIVYKGDAISKEEISNNSQYLKSYEDHIFYKESPEWYSKIQVNDSVILQVINQDKGPLQTKSQLSNGSWFLFGVIENKSYLIKEVNITSNNIHGYLKIYGNTDSAISKILKFKNGILVDTISIFNNNDLIGYEIRDSLGQKLLESASYYPNSQDYANFTDYIMGYAFTFFEDGTISSVVKIKSYRETGLLLEFDKEGNVIRKTLSQEK